MHGLEHAKSTNTGRLVERCFTNARITLFGNNLPELPDELWPPGAKPVVLFPVAGAQPIEDFRGVDRVCLVVLDANWRQAARLRKRFALRSVPFARAPAVPTLYRLRGEPHEGGMSTFEAVVHSLGALEDVDTAPLLRAFRIFQDRTLWTRGTIDKSAVEGGIPDGALRHQP
jgi:DTW domain-containing protein YfiP